MSSEIAPSDEAKIRELVESGRYPDANAVMLEALRLLEEHERQEELRASLEERGRDVSTANSTKLNPALGDTFAPRRGPS